MEIHRFAKGHIEYHSRKGLLLEAIREAIDQRASPLHFVQSLQFCWEFRCKPDSYYRHRIFKNWHRRHRYIFDDEIFVILRDLNRRFAPIDSADITDKRRFERRCSVAGLPCVISLAEFPVSVRPTDPQRDLFVKYPDKARGEGAESWRYANGRYHNGSRSLSFTRLAEELSTRSRTNPLLLQPRYSSHPDIVDISGDALSTVRTVTVLDGSNPRICAAVYRASTTNVAADNFALGGLAAPIDLATGEMGRAVVKDIRRKPNRFDVHPTAGGRFVGRKIPFWDQVQETSLRAHEAFCTMPSVGWDIALTTDGPILLEGNEIWCVDLVQMSYEAALADGPIPELLHKFIKIVRTA